MALTMMKGDAKSLFESCLLFNRQNHKRTAVASAGADAIARATAEARPLEEYQQPADVESALNFIIQQRCPPKALQKVKRYLRRECRKPFNLKFREFYTHLNRINNHELNHLPPFGGNQALADDKILDILQFAVPKSWIKEADRQGFDCFAEGINETIDFFERIEETDDFTPVENKKNSNKKSGNSKNGKDSSGKKGDKYCMLHGHGIHSTEECHSLKSQVKRLKDNNGDKKSAPYKNKTWTRKGEDGDNKYSPKEVNTIVKKEVKKQLLDLKKKKRKAEAEAVHAIEKGMSKTSLSDSDDNFNYGSDDDSSASVIST